MKILITGGKGMFGRTLQQELSDFRIVVADLPEADITDAQGFDALLKKELPDAPQRSNTSRKRMRIW